MFNVEPGRSVVFGAGAVGVQFVIEINTSVVQKVTALRAKTSNVPVSKHWLRFQVKILIVEYFDNFFLDLDDLFDFFLLRSDWLCNGLSTASCSKLFLKLFNLFLSFIKSDDVGVL